MIVWVPVPETEGSKVPAEGFVIPGPLQVPPGVTDVRFAPDPFTQNGPAALIVLLAVWFTTITVLPEALHPFVVIPYEMV